MVAVGQIIIYSGAIVVLFLFVVTLLPVGRPRAGADVGPRRRRGRRRRRAAGRPGGGAGRRRAPRPTPQRDPGDLGVAAVGRALFGPLLVAFELTAPLLLVAIVGAVVIWRRHEPRPRIAPRPTRATEPRRLVMHR